MKVLQMSVDSCSMDWGHAPIRIPYGDMLYEAAQTVFRSLPPVEVVRNFSDEAMKSWNEIQDYDNRDSWHYSCQYWQRPIMGGYKLRFETATSAGRSVEVSVIGGEIADCSVVFLFGSENAAGGILDLCQDALSSWIAHFIVSQDLERHQYANADFMRRDVRVTTLEESGIEFRRMGELVPMHETNCQFFYTIELGSKQEYLLQQATAEMA